MKTIKNLKLKGKLIATYTGILVVFSITVALLIQNRAQDLSNTIYNESLTSMNNLGKFMIDTKYEGDWSVKDGELYKGDVKISEQNSVLDTMKEQTGYFTTIFLGDTRIATNVLGTDGVRAIGTQATPEVVTDVLTNGKEYSGVTQVVGQDTYVRYEPIKDQSGKNIGMFFTGVSKATVDAKIADTVKVAVGFMAVLLLGGVLITIFIGNMIVKKIQTVSLHLGKMSDKDFSGSLSKDILESSDELGDIARAAQTVSVTLSQVIGTINSEANNIEGAMNTSVNELTELADLANKATYSTQNIAATIEETASSMTNISETSQNINDSISDMSQDAKEGAKTAENINKRATELKESADKSQQTALQVLETNKKNINSALKNAESINEIETLTQAISRIASRTSLLSLNAAVEASRAGEAGAGFAVVAGEVKKLSEECSETATRIQNTTERVISSVDELVNCTTDILDFINSNVLDDYKKLAETGEQYHKDAEFVKQFTESISGRTVALVSDMNDISESISGMVEATNESAKSIEQIAYTAETVSEKSSVVSGLSSDAQGSVDSLTEYVSTFKL